MAESQTVAKQALKKLEDQLTCGVCLDASVQRPQTAPAMLPCLLQGLPPATGGPRQTGTTLPTLPHLPTIHPPSPSYLVCLASRQHLSLCQASVSSMKPAMFTLSIL